MIGNRDLIGNGLWLLSLIVLLFFLFQEPEKTMINMINLSPFILITGDFRCENKFISYTPDSILPNLACGNSIRTYLIFRLNTLPRFEIEFSKTFQVPSRSKFISRRFYI